MLFLFFGAASQLRSQEASDTPQVTPAVTYDNNGYDKNGYDKEGYDKEGYNRDGIDRNGFDRSGNYHSSVNENTIDREKEKSHPRQDVQENTTFPKGTNEYDDGSKPLNEGK